MNTKRERGSIPLAVAISIAVTVGGFLATMLTVSSTEVFKARQESYLIRSEFLADLALEEGIAWLRRAQTLSSLDDPFSTLDGMNVIDWTPIFDDEPAFSGNNRLGTFSVWLRLAPPNGSDPYVRDVEILAEGRFEMGRGELAHDGRGVRRRMIARSELVPSSAFDHGYAVNNWGWFYGNSITVNGNVSSNGQFDAGGYSPTVNGRQRFAGIIENPDGSFTLDGYRDEGGIFSGWDIVNAENVGGMGGDSANQHPFRELNPMPNLANLGLYEAMAFSEDSSVTVSEGLESPQVIRNVFGDGEGESGNLYLQGTADAPIVIDGPVVVRGHVFIKGVVTGQGSIYAGGNIYVGDDVTYLDAPTATTPASGNKADIEAWITANNSKDILGLYASEHIIIGDASTSAFQSSVGSWLSHPLNKSEEDAGIDGIPNTRVGRDGIAGTRDDDLLEDDHHWTVDRYTPQQAALGLIPEGKDVGDPIPGTGEDIDGDGVYDSGTTLEDLQMHATEWEKAWGGNRPEEQSYTDLATNDIARLDSAFYTNHTLGARVINTGGTIQWNGAIVCRNEAITYSANLLEMNHDARLTGGGGHFKLALPMSWSRIQAWEVPMFAERVGTAPTP